MGIRATLPSSGIVAIEQVQAMFMDEATKKLEKAFHRDTDVFERRAAASAMKASIRFARLLMSKF